jgi:hypothetical protein
MQQTVKLTTPRVHRDRHDIHVACGGHGVLEIDYRAIADKPVDVPTRGNEHAHAPDISSAEVTHLAGPVAALSSQREWRFPPEPVTIAVGIGACYVQSRWGAFSLLLPGTNLIETEPRPNVAPGGAEGSP